MSSKKVAPGAPLKQKRFLSNIGHFSMTNEEAEASGREPASARHRRNRRMRMITCNGVCANRICTNCMATCIVCKMHVCFNCVMRVAEGADSGDALVCVPCFYTNYVQSGSIVPIAQRGIEMPECCYPADLQRLKPYETPARRNLDNEFDSDNE